MSVSRSTSPNPGSPNPGLPNPGSPDPAPGSVPTALDVGIALVWTLVVPALAAIAFLLGVKATGGSSAAIPWVLPVAAAPGALGQWWWFVRRRGWGWRELGFTRPTRSLWHLLWVTPLAIAGSAMVAASVAPLVGVSPGAAGGSVTRAAAGPLLTVCLLLTAVVVVPAVEEVTFRRILFGWLCARTKGWVAVLLTGIVFGLVHLVPAVICYVLPLGIALTAIRVWLDTVWASLTVHAVNNALVMGLLLMALR